MSYHGVNDKDLGLKLRLMNILWTQGWFVRPNVQLYRYQEGKRTSDQYTDIDVLAIKLFTFQNPVVAVCSAKSGKESDSEQVYWLAGVKSYFGASIAFYVRAKASLTRAKSLCQKLDIVPLNDEQLKVLEQRFGINSSSLQSNFTEKIFLQMSSHFDQLKEKKPAIYNYISERYWIEPPSNQLLSVLTVLRDLRVLTLTDDCRLFMKYYLASLLALPIFEVAHSLISTPASTLRGELQTAIMGGEMARRDKEKVLSAVKSFLEDVARKRGLLGASITNGIDFETSIQDMTRDLYDIVLAMVEHYNQAVYVPRLVDALMYQAARKQRDVPRLEDVTLPDITQSDWKHVAKLTRDFLLFMQRIGVFDRSDISI